MRLAGRGSDGLDFPEFPRRGRDDARPSLRQGQRHGPAHRLHETRRHHGGLGAGNQDLAGQLCGGQQRGFGALR